jgi:YegS/Rv2252/BmrU family lipid kinase
MRELTQRGIEIVHDPGTVNVDCVVVVGGDGTVYGVLNEIVRRGVPLGVVPVGTFNELARTLGIPFDIAQACEAIATRATRTIDLALVNGRHHYISEASIGISSHIARMQTPQLKKRLGLLAVIATTFAALRYSRAMHAEIRFDDRIESLKVVQLTVANSHRFGGVVDITDAAIDDGWLDLYAVNIESFGQAFSVARALLQGKRESVPGLQTFRSKQFSVRTRRSHHISADGEPAGKTPAVFEVVPKALRVFVPAGKA